MAEEMTRRNNDRATIYDCMTGEEIRQATVMEEWRYIAQLLSMSGNQRIYGVVDGSEYDHDGSIYMQGGRVRSSPISLTWITIARGQLWNKLLRHRTDESWLLLT